MKKKVLIAATNHDKHPVEGKNTGLWLSELAHSFQIFKAEGYSVDIVSPKGGKIPVDPKSLSILYLDKLTRRYCRNGEFIDSLESSLSPPEIDWYNYDLMFYTGGHGALWDIPECSGLQEIGRKIYENGGILSAVSHGVSGLLNIRLSNGTYLLSNKFVTGYSNMEETLSKMSRHVPFLLQDELVKRGANYKKAPVPLRPFSLRCGRLVTGQNPMSTRAVAFSVLQLINNVAPTGCNAIF
ncbi:MAG: type 1 glutamine amidotransferase domain-containing protein [Bacillota bacterium]|nr:type 1 glutamine amidotransferase domain-containing protein [Bacillota bacterium]